MRPHPLQADLFALGIPDGEIVGPGRARTFSGAAMEEVIIKLFNLTPGRTVGTQAVCPDAYTVDDRPAEIKSLKRGSALPIYEWRAEKDHADTVYFIGIHSRPPARTVREIWEGMATSLRQVLIIPGSAVYELARGYPLRKIKMTATASGERNGYQRAGYRDGYRSIPARVLLAEVEPLPFEVSTMLHGLHFAVRPHVFKSGSLGQ